MDGFCFIPYDTHTHILQKRKKVSKYFFFKSKTYKLITHSLNSVSFQSILQKRKKKKKKVIELFVICFDLRNLISLPFFYFMHLCSQKKKRNKHHNQKWIAFRRILFTLLTHTLKFIFRTLFTAPSLGSYENSSDIQLFLFNR